MFLFILSIFCALDHVKMAVGWPLQPVVGVDFSPFLKNKLRNTWRADCLLLLGIREKALTRIWRVGKRQLGCK